MKKALVTGASGLIGKAICIYFLERNWEVVGIRNNSESGIIHKNFTEQSIDLLRNRLPKSSVECDLIIHCASIIPRDRNAEDQLFELNSLIDENVFTTLKSASVNRVIYLSTAYLYSDQHYNRINEDIPLKNDLKGYYLSKQMSEEFLINSKLNFIIFRISSPYGNIDLQTNVMKLFSINLRKNLPITLIGRGERKQNFIHLDDIVTACYLGSSNSLNGVYNLTYKESYSMLQLACFMKEIYQSKSIIQFQSERFDNSQNVNFDNTKLKVEFGWEPILDLEKGLIKTLVS